MKRPSRTFAEILFVSLLLALAACDGDGSGDSGFARSLNDGSLLLPGGSSGGACGESGSLDAQLCEEIERRGLTGVPEAGLTVPDINSDPLARLGRDLFFSKALSGRADVACASCHDPRPPFFGSDNLSLPVGVNALDPDHVGPGRVHNPDDPAADADPEADVGPNVPRRSLTTFNSVLYDEALFYDGRVRWVEPGNPDAGMVTPEAPIFETDPSAPTQARFPLLQAQARNPVASSAEMRGFGVLPSQHGKVMRDYIAARLGDYAEGAGELTNNDWNARFQQVFDARDPEENAWITFERIARALAAYQASQLFVDNPWRDYVKNGRLDALTEKQKKGALLFFRDRGGDERGAGCARCHSGDHFTDEEYHIVATPQFGRGKGEGSHARDKGFGHTSWDRSLDDFRFRTTSLLNVAEQAAFGHTGAWESLEAVIRHHADPAGALATYDWTLNTLRQFSALDIVYQDAQTHTEEALARLEELRAGSPDQPVLRDVALSDTEVEQLAAFLKALTDYRLKQGDPADFAPWVADKPLPAGCGLGSPCDLDRRIASSGPIWPSVTELTNPHEPAVSIDTSTYQAPNADGIRTRFVNNVDLQYNCTMNAPPSVPADAPLFQEVGQSKGLDYQLQYPDFEETPENVYGTAYMVAGGVAAADLDNDCYSDVYLPRGRKEAVLLENRGGEFVRQTGAAVGPAERTGNISSANLRDLDGDGLHDLIVPGFDGTSTEILQGTSAFGFGNTIAVTQPGTPHSIYSVTAADYDLSGRLDLFASFWSAASESQQDYLWHNAGDRVADETFVDLYGATEASGLRGEISERFTFVGNLKDVTGNGWPDLLSVADFGHSQIFHNEGAQFTNATSDSGLTDENGMGTTLLDVNGDGNLDWFVTSVYASEEQDTISTISGNRMYLNSGSGDFFSATDDYGVRDGGWGWSACSKDFRNNGFEDIVHTNGWGHLRHQDEDPHPFELFLDDRPRLYLRDASGDSFTDHAAAEGMLPGEGRGLICTDFNRDGAVDILVVNNGGRVHYYRNNARSLYPDHNFLTLRLRAPGPNWEGIGARITLDLGDRVIRRYLGSNNYVSSNPVEAHFGLGPNEQIERIGIEWPAIAVDGTVYRDLTLIRGSEIRLNTVVDVVHPGCSTPAADRCGSGNQGG